MHIDDYTDLDHGEHMGHDDVHGSDDGLLHPELDNSPIIPGLEDDPHHTPNHDIHGNTPWSHDKDEQAINDLIRKQKEYHSSFNGGKSDEEWYAYYQEKVNNAIKKEAEENKEAVKALNNGDEKAYNDHMWNAKIAKEDAHKFARSRDMYKKSK